MSLRLILLSAVLMGSLAQAFEIRWLKLDLNIKYSDPTIKCDNLDNMGRPMEDGAVYLALEIDGDAVVSAQINNFPKQPPYTLALYKFLRLSSKDTDGIELYKDPKGQFWLKKLTLSQGVLRWVLSYSTDLALHCKVPQPIKSTDPLEATFNFDTEGLGEGFSTSPANWSKVKGTRQDGKAFNAEVQLIQLSKFLY